MQVISQVDQHLLNFKANWTGWTRARHCWYQVSCNDAYGFDSQTFGQEIMLVS